MCVYKPKGSNVYHYDFWVKGIRYRESTWQTDLEDAKTAEQRKKLEIRRSYMGLAVAPPGDPVKKKRKPKRPPNWVYFIRCDRHVKIGSTYDVAVRLRELQIGCPYRLHLLLKVDGTDREERVIHRMFKHLRSRGEWYKLEPDLRRFIQDLRANKDLAKELILGDEIAAEVDSTLTVKVPKSGPIVVNEIAS